MSRTLRVRAPRHGCGCCGMRLLLGSGFALVTLVTIMLHMSLANSMQSVRTVPADPPSLAQINDAAVVYLCSNSSVDLANIRTSIKYLHAALLWRHPYRVIIFNEGNLPREAVTNLQRDAAARVPPTALTFEYVELNTPRQVLEAGIKPNWHKRSLWGYHNMIRFWHSLVQARLEALGVRYYMRLDSDSWLLGPWWAARDGIGDPIEVMRAKQCVYGYNKVERDFGPTVQGLWNFTLSYAQSHDLKMRWHGSLVANELGATSTRGIGPWGDTQIPIFYNNFEIGFVPFFRSRPMRDFAGAVDNSLGIYRFRWGDAPLRYLAISLFAKESDLCFFGPESYPYHHGRWGMRDVLARIVNSASMRLLGRALYVPGRNRGTFELRASNLRGHVLGSDTIPTQQH